ncbi:MAG: FAD-binding oxidoreductase [Syntrophales bacterium]|nr:FAD-binding oxidoreductase [Syntrophales bacterium]
MRRPGGIEKGIIHYNREAGHGHYVMAIELPRIFGDSLPGQFMMIRKPGFNSPLLARPFSIFSRKNMEEKTVVEVIYRVVGTGTELLASCEVGDILHVMGPLGRGFYVDNRLRKIVLVAGGVGVAPLSFLAEHCREHPARKHLEIISYMGARTETLLVGIERLELLCDRVKVATDDGSRGFHGAVTELFSQDIVLDGGDETGFYACGPRAMMRKISEMSAGSGMKCQVVQQVTPLLVRGG